MSDTIEIRVPDIGDFKDVPVIEVLVKPGETIAKEAPLLVLESDKASMEVPSSAAGVVKDVKVNVGDKVSQGTVILTLGADAEASADAAPASAAPSVAQASAPQTSAAPPAASATTTIALTVPDIGDFKDIPVIEVLVKPGDTIAKEAPLLVLESDKASMEVPASAAGVVQDVKVKVGDKVSQGTVVAMLAVSGEAPQSAAGVQQAQGDAGKAQAVATESVQSAPQRAPGAVREAGSDAGIAQSAARRASNGAVVHASPAIRRFARELGVDLHGLSGSGPHGRVTRDDVQNFVKSALLSGTSATGGSGGSAVLGGLPPWPKVDFAQYGAIERKPLSRIKKLSGPNLHRNWVQIPHITNYDEADVTDLEAFRNEVNVEQTKRGGAKLTMLAFLVKASVAALRRFPEFNASLDGEELVYKNYYNIGFAADTPNGLVVPVLKAADTKGLLQIAAESAELAGKARDGKLGLSDMQGGTFTISSIGGIGGTAFTQIVNAPEVAILGAVRASVKPVWDGAEFVPRTILPVSVSYDHRVIDGAGAARFLAFFTGLLADFKRVSL